MFDGPVVTTAIVTDDLDLSDPRFLSQFAGYPVQLPIFQGPLDLLIYLIERQQIDIYDIPIATITSQYLKYLEVMGTLNLEVAGEFLVMAATLLEIKSRMLLPQPELPLDEEEGIDPRAELAARIAEYRKYQQAADSLKDMKKERSLIFSRDLLNGNNGNGHGNGSYVLTGQASGLDLWAAFQTVLARAVERPITRIEREKITVSMKIREISNRLKERPQGLRFDELFRPSDAQPNEGIIKLEVIVTFLALLELIRVGRARVEQPHLFGEIRIYSHATRSGEREITPASHRMSPLPGGEPDIQS